MGTERQINKMCKAAERAGASGLGTLLNTIIDLLNDRALSDQVLPTQAGLGATLAVDNANAENVQTTTNINVLIDGVVYNIAGTAEIDISTLSCAGDTIAQAKSGIGWVMVNRAGVVDVETDKIAQDYSSVIEAYAAYATASNTLPVADHVSIGAVQVTEGNSGAWIWGTDSITGETEFYKSFEGLPEIVSAMASFALELANAEDYSYGAAVLKLGDGTIITATGETDSVVLAGTVEHGYVGAWLFYILADDVAWAEPVGLAYASKAAAEAAIAALKSNPYMPEMGYIFVQNQSASDFTGGTTELAATGITTTFEILTAKSGGITKLT